MCFYSITWKWQNKQSKNFKTGVLLSRVLRSSPAGSSLGMPSAIRILSMKNKLVISLELGLRPYLPDEYFRIKCFWCQRSKISEGIDVLKYYFFLAGYITTYVYASTLITVSLKRTTKPSVATIIHINDENKICLDHFRPYKFAPMLGDNIHLKIVGLHIY